MGFTPTGLFTHRISFPEKIREKLVEPRGTWQCAITRSIEVATPSALYFHSMPFWGDLQRRQQQGSVERDVPARVISVVKRHFGTSLTQAVVRT